MALKKRFSTFFGRRPLFHSEKRLRTTNENERPSRIFGFPNSNFNIMLFFYKNVVTDFPAPVCQYSDQCWRILGCCPILNKDKKKLASFCALQLISPPTTGWEPLPFDLFWLYSKIKNYLIHFKNNECVFKLFYKLFWEAHRLWAFLLPSKAVIISTVSFVRKEKCFNLQE